MTIKLLFFAALREAVGHAALTKEISGTMTAAEVFLQVQKEYPQAARFAGAISFAVNGDYAAPEVELKHGDELALLPPISGGRDG